MTPSEERDREVTASHLVVWLQENFLGSPLWPGNQFSSLSSLTAWMLFTWDYGSVNRRNDSLSLPTPLETGLALSSLILCFTPSSQGLGLRVCVNPGTICVGLCGAEDRHLLPLQQWQHWKQFCILVSSAFSQHTLSAHLQLCSKTLWCTRSVLWLQWQLLQLCLPNYICAAA